MLKDDYNDIPSKKNQPSETTTDYTTLYNDSSIEKFDTTKSVLLDTISPSKREVFETPTIMTPGVCVQGCMGVFLLFAAISGIINLFGASGRITNLLINYRCVDKKDKAFSQGLFLMFISLFAMIPGPILYGWVIDQACLVWNFKCQERGNCQLYDQTAFRYYFNVTAMGKFTIYVTNISYYFLYFNWNLFHG